MNDTLRRVEERLRPWARSAPIAPDTELYRDLGIYGDDLAFDAVLWATREFGMAGKIYLTKYAPSEGPFHRPRGWVRRLLRMKPRQFKSLTVRDVVAAIEAKRWPD